MSTNTVNSDWVNQESDVKNCYLNVGGHFNEDSAYNTYELYSKDCFDNWWILKSELSYENVNCERCYKTLFSKDCFDCRETVFSYDCRNCNNIFGCAGLRNKQYCVFNKQLSKEEYQEFIKNDSVRSFKNLKKLKEQAEKIWLSIPHKDKHIVKSIDSIGNAIVESKKCVNCWQVEKNEDCKHQYFCAYLKDVYDASAFGWGELCYECASSAGYYDSKFVTYGFAGGDGVHSSSVEYVYSAPSCRNCFGCANIKNKEYYILNKQYTKEEYEELLPKIKKHMSDMPYVDKKGRVYKYGEFFPIELSPFGYNETTAQDYFPLNREEALEKGYLWNDYETDANYKFSDYEIPDDIKDVEDDILEKVLKCEVSGRPYKIIPMELEFYRKIGLPIPRRAPLQRHKDRLAKLLPRKLFDKMCQCEGGKGTNRESQITYINTTAHFHGDDACPNQIKTPYAPEKPEIVYCEACYQAEIT